MKGTFLILFVTIQLSSFYFRMSESFERCNRKCGSKTVPYPFGFSEGCLNRLKCLKDGNVTMGGFKIENISTDGVLVHHEFQCRQSFQELNVFKNNYALTARNVLMVRNCTKPDSGCTFDFKSIIKKFLSKDKGIQGCNISDFSCLSNDTEGFIPWDYLERSNCSTLLTNMVVESDSLELKVNLGKVEVGWWVDGECPNACSRNAKCSNFTSPITGRQVHRCHCKDGYQGDGFALGDGCRKGSSKCNPSRYMSGHCGGTTRVAVLFGGLFAGATLVLVVVLVYCFLKRSSLALETRRSQKRLLSANGGSFAIPLFTYKELEKATKGFSEKERLGNGAFGTVYAGKLHGNQWVAVKRIRHIDTYGIEQVMNEIKLLSSVDHPNLVRLMGCCIEKGEPILVYEYMPNGTLSQHLQRERGEGLSWTQRITLAAETAHALAYLHSAINPPIYHRDVKSSNILLDYGFNSKVADFGLSRIVLTESSHISTVPQGTPGYLDPQYHQNFHLSDKSDVYSFGVVLVEIITALKVVDFLRKKSEINLASLAINRIGSGCVDEIIDPFLEADKYPRVRMTVHRVAELAFRCLAFDRDARPTMLEVAEELDFIRDTIQDKQPQVDNNQNIFTLPEEGNCSVLCAGDEEDDAKFRRRSTDSVKQSRRNSTGSRRIMIQSPLMDELKAVILDKMDTASPVSVQDPWVSAQSSPSTSSLLENVIE